MVAIERHSDQTRPAEVAPAPIDAIPAGARRRTASPRQVFAVCALGALVLALLASRDLPSWADRLQDGPMSSLARTLAIGWNERIAPLGLTRPHRELHRALTWLRAQQWP
ncbi:MAG TPA: hypothetical protein VE993_19735 [Stellaceae bacterium]|nr:hypothetical protein [Stellaceae bacterium]